MNLHNAPLLGEKVIKVFEFGNVFSKEVEERHLSYGFACSTKKDREELVILLDAVYKLIFKSLKLNESDYQEPNMYISSDLHHKETMMTAEINFDKLIESLPEPKDYEPLLQNKIDVSYKSVSAYPFIVRDIACFTPADTTWEDVLAIINKNDNPLIVRRSLFDTFKKTFEDSTIKMSYAFRLVIQSFEKTLTDDEANEIANKTYNDLKEKGWEIR